MRLNLFAVSCLLVTLAQGAANAQESPPSTATNPVLEERLRNAQVNEKTLSNGAVITEVKFAGSLQPNFDLGCIPISEVTSQFNPPALIYAAKKCIQLEEYQKAWALFTTANDFAYYDLKRLADVSTHGALSVLVATHHSSGTAAKRRPLNSFVSQP